MTILIAALIFNPLLPVHLLRNPLKPNPAEPLTVSAFRGVSDLSNYASFGLSLAGTLILAFVLYKATSRRNWFALYPARARQLLIGIALAAFVLFTPYAADSPTFRYLSAPLTDEFHEGEILGLAPYLHAAPDIAKPLLIHGPGMDLMPAWVGMKLAPPGLGIAAIRLLYRLLGSGAVLTLLLALYAVVLEVEETSGLPAAQAGMLRYWVVGFWMAAVINLSQIGPRRLFLWLQFALLVFAVRFVRSRSKFSLPDAALFAAIGAILPVAVAYNYSAGIAGAAITLTGLFLLACRYGTRFVPDLLTAAVSALGAGVLIAVLAGPGAISAMFRDLVYWASNARAVTFTPAFYGFTATTESLGVVAVFGILIWASSRALRNVLRSRNSFDSTCFCAVFLVLAIFELRPYLDRTDLQHLQHIVPSFLLIGLYVLYPVFAVPAASVSQFIPSSAQDFMKWTAIAIFGFASVLTAHPIMGFYGAALTIGQPSRLPDRSLIDASEQQIVREIEPELNGQSCFFALSNSAVWYYLFDRPSCSAFYEPMYARNQAAQDQIVSDLRLHKPRVVLAVDRKGILIDDLPLEVTCPGVWAYLQSAYVPFKSIDGRDFYRLREPDPQSDH